MEVRMGDKPCAGRNSNVCVAEGCYGEACVLVGNELDGAEGRRRDAIWETVSGEIRREQFVDDDEVIDFVTIELQVKTRPDWVVYVKERFCAEDWDDFIFKKGAYAFVLDRLVERLEEEIAKDLASRTTP